MQLTKGLTSQLHICRQPPCALRGYRAAKNSHDTVHTIVKAGQVSGNLNVRQSLVGVKFELDKGPGKPTHEALPMSSSCEPGMTPAALSKAASVSA